MEGKTVNRSVRMSESLSKEIDKYILDKELNFACLARRAIKDFMLQFPIREKK